MNHTIKDVLEFVEENDVKFAKLAFVDTFGKLRNISLLASELEDAFENGVSIDNRAIEGLEYESNVRLFPDASTLQVLPWRPQHGAVIRMYCHLKRIDGSYADCDGRALLVQAQDKMKSLGYTCSISSDVEFYLFLCDDSGRPTYTPYDRAGYLDVAPLDKGENVRREICFTLEKLGLKPLSSHHEKGPGQNEIKFKYNDALMAADDLITFKSTVKSIANESGLHASFLPKPMLNEEGSALKINFSLARNGEDKFLSNTEIESFIAGVLNRAEELTLFINPTINSYDRFSSNMSPRYLAWGRDKFHQIIRVSSLDETVMHFNSADPSCNPYIAYALLLNAGVEGIEKNMKLPDAPIEDIINDAKFKTVPLNMQDAIKLAEKSEFAKACLSEKFFNYIIDYKKKEWEEYSEHKDKYAYVLEKYFDKI